MCSVDGAALTAPVVSLARLLLILFHFVNDKYKSLEFLLLRSARRRRCRRRRLAPNLTRSSSGKEERASSFIYFNQSNLRSMDQKRERERK